jgi:ABC-type microcin C transport system duplicated ATPase subunit YejF
MNKASDFVLSVRNLSVAFGGDRAAQVTDLVSFDIAAGEFFALVENPVVVKVLLP